MARLLRYLPRIHLCGLVFAAVGLFSPLAAGAEDYCPDNLCTGSEDAMSCPSDCSASCGDMLCTHDESPMTCSGDCGTCGNEVCDAEEDSSSCSTDCYCGNGSCGSGEDAMSCPSDCSASCGDMFCTHDESPMTCSGDCGTCGNETCDAEEDLVSCPSDCSDVTPTATSTPPQATATTAPTVTPTGTPTSQPATPTATPEVSATPVATETPTASGTPSAEPTATATETPEPSPTSEPTATETPLPPPTEEPTATETPSPSPSPTGEPTETSTPTPTATPDCANPAPADTITGTTGTGTKADPYKSYSIADGVKYSFEDYREGETSTVGWTTEGSLSEGHKSRTEHWNCDTGTWFTYWSETSVDDTNWEEFDPIDQTYEKTIWTKYQYYSYQWNEETGTLEQLDEFEYSDLGKTKRNQDGVLWHDTNVWWFNDSQNQTGHETICDQTTGENCTKTCWEEGQVVQCP